MFRKIKAFIQRGKKGWADEDVWSFDHYLAGLIVGALDSLKKNSIGCPGHLYDKKNINNECWKWKQIIEEIRQGFKASQQLFTFDYLMAEKNGVLKKELDIKREQDLTKKYKRGIKLFCKYFQCLWD